MALLLVALIRRVIWHAAPIPIRILVPMILIVLVILTLVLILILTVAARLRSSCPSSPETNADTKTGSPRTTSPEYYPLVVLALVAPVILALRAPVVL